MDDANSIAESIGMYFDGCSDGRDCSCCGDRWYPTYGKGDDVPSIYGDEIVNGEIHSDSRGWMGENPEGFIHYKNGNIEPLRIVKDNEDDVDKDEEAVKEVKDQVKNWNKMVSKVKAEVKKEQKKKAKV
jgi:hypothetical protein